MGIMGLSMRAGLEMSLHGRRCTMSLACLEASVHSRLFRPCAGDHMTWAVMTAPRQAVVLLPILAGPCGAAPTVCKVGCAPIWQGVMWGLVAAPVDMWQQFPMAQGSKRAY
jgi:hypothetical protein